MLRAAALICILSYGLCYESIIENYIGTLHGVSSLNNSDVTSSSVPIPSEASRSNVPIPSDTTSSIQCRNLRCTERQCSRPDPSKIITLRNLGQNSQCSCSCCGYRKRVEPTNRILSDSRPHSIANEYPWIVAILKVEYELGIRSYDYKCVGSLIHPSVVLTAAHCISKIESSKLIIRVGEHNTLMSVENNNRTNIQVAEYIIHEEYADYNYDIALMFLNEPVIMNANVSTICLPPQNANFDSQKCRVSGWGKDAIDGNFQTTLRTVELPIVPRDECIRSLRTTELGDDFELSDSIICAGGEANKDTCEGDGGAPLVCKIPDSRNQYHQVGIVSWGVGCGDSIPAAYVNVALFRNWIDEKLRSKNVTY